jgi:7,8-dihydropterin-6-yl-methyl-4-(beta-D-ribofuranosyl)aminobenzene 5'-phosphate synthase
MKITVAIDNCILPKAKKPFRAEHGLALLIETAAGKYLFDSGQTDAAIYNLGLLGVHPGELAAIILSHGHYDHTGGLAAVLAQAGRRLPVYCHRDVFSPRFAVDGSEVRYAGLPWVKDYLVSLGADFHMVDEPLALTPELTISGPVPRVTGYETGDAHLMAADAAGACGCRQDTVPDDMAIYYKSEKGLLVISGCAHSGIVNVIRHGQSVTAADRLYGLIGGTHLGPAGAGQQDETLAELAALGPQLVAANHCTGFYMLARLYGQFGDKFKPAFVGTVFEV